MATSARAQTVGVPYMAAHHKTLSDGLTEKQKETLGKFDDCQCELIDINERELFVYAFKLGMRFAIEAMS